jgi:hypothetical protein
VTEYLVFLSPKFVPLKEYSDRFARHLPTSYAHAFGAPAFEECFALLEGEIGVVTEVGAEEDDFVFMFYLHGSSTCRKNGIDTAHTIAYFPTCFENVFGLHG